MPAQTSVLLADAVVDLLDRHVDFDGIELLHDLIAHALALLLAEAAGVILFDGDTLATAAALVTTLTPGTAHMLAVEVRLNGKITIPEQSCARPSAPRASWCACRQRRSGPHGLDYDVRFRARYAPCAPVLARDPLADSGLGYPSYLGALRALPAWRMLTERDDALLVLIRQSVKTDAEEIDLSDANIDALTVGEHADLVLPQRVELGVTVHAASTATLQTGELMTRFPALPRGWRAASKAPPSASITVTMRSSRGSGPRHGCRSTRAGPDNGRLRPRW